MFLVFFIFYIFFFVPIANASSAAKYGGKIINQALDEVLGSKKSTIRKPFASEINAKQFPYSRVRLRCENYTACVDSTPMIEIDNAVVRGDVIYLYQPDAESMEVISRFPNLLGAKSDRLPIVQQKIVQRDSTTEGPIRWLPGPQIVIKQTMKDLRCDKIWDTSAYFLHPWEVTNTFHALNDNVLKILASVVLQRYTLREGDNLGTDNKSLFIFYPSV